MNENRELESGVGSYHGRVHVKWTPIRSKITPNDWRPIDSVSVGHVVVCVESKHEDEEELGPKLVRKIDSK